MTTNQSPPDACTIAFKEWAGVCDALGSGRQSLILRKGGVLEGPGGFRPEHPAFWLYPTFVHEAEQGLRAPTSVRRAETSNLVAIETLVVVDWVGRVEHVEQLEGLASFHDWTEATVLKRFHYRSPGLWALAVRAYRRPGPWMIAVTPVQLGCKTWVSLELPPTALGLMPVLPAAESSRIVSLIRSSLEAGAGVQAV